MDTLPPPPEVPGGEPADGEAALNGAAIGPVPGGPRKTAERPSPATMRARLSLLIGNRRWMVAGLAACSILSGLTEAATLALVAQLASSLVGKSHGANAHQGTLSVLNFHAGTRTLILAGFGLCALRLLFQIPLATFSARIAADVQARLRIELFDAFNRASWSVQSQDREGQLQEVITGQVMQAVSGAIGATGLINSGFQFVVLLAAALLLNPVAAVSVGLLSLTLFALLRPLRAAGGRNARELSRAQVAYASGVAESNRVAEESHVFGAGESQRANVHGLAMRSQKFFYRSQVLIRMVSNLYQTVIYVILVAGLGVLYIVGGHHAGSLGGVILVLVRAGTTGQTVQSSYQGLIQALPFVERTQKALERYREHGESYGEAPLSSVDSIAFQHVSFSYSSAVQTLSDISFTVAGKEAIGVVGPSGAGKSTLVQLLLRLRDPVSGAFIVNGAPATDFSSADWHRQVSYVPQDPRLLHATVAENIRFFRDISDADVERAATLARIHDDIMSWPNGYQAIVGPRADAVSGGQQQRICLARALAARPSLLVLDEPTSALDPQSESLIADSLYTIRNELTLFIVAHRMSTLEMCDRVMVIVDGRLVGLDTRAELNRSNDYYRRASELSIVGRTD